MEFNAGKCKLLSITKQTTRCITFKYSIHGTLLESMEKVKFPVIKVNRKLNWNNLGKVRDTLTFLQRNFSSDPKCMNEQLYSTRVRPNLDYALFKMSRHTAENKRKLKAVEKKVARFVPNIIDHTYCSNAMVESHCW